MWLNGSGGRAAGLNTLIQCATGNPVPVWFRPNTNRIDRKSRKKCFQKFG